MSNQKKIGSASARSALRKQQRTATLVSLIVALLLMVLIGLILAIILFAVNPEEKPAIIAYSGQVVDDQQIVKKPKIRTEVARTPAAPSLAMSRVVVANSSSAMAIPIPEIQVEDISMEIGMGEDFGSGWQSDDGFGTGATFFGQMVKAERIAYVIDYSASMRAQKRHELMRAELSESLSLMHPGLQIGMIFFSGPAWVAGDTVKDGVVTTAEGEIYHFEKGKSHSTWEHQGKKQKVPWWTITDDEVERLTEIVQKTPLSLGTVWDSPLHMALDMDPPPQTIYFMTDGSANQSDVWAKDIGRRAKKMGVVINCVALMEPKAVKDLLQIADLSGGQLTMVNEKGEREQIKVVSDVKKEEK